MKTKTEKYSFTFDKATSELLKQIVKKTDLSQIIVVQRGIEMFAREKGVINEER